jgi:MarR family transcriptional regulator, 2-MHQ and catechol-resistance regulon repressor
MPTHFKGPAKETRALDVYIKLSRAFHTLNAELQRELATVELTEGQFGILETLHHLGSMNQREIGRKLLCSSANVCTVLDNLERAGHIRRERSTDDRRVVIVSLTSTGRKLIQKVFPEHASRIASLMSALDADEQELLGALCKKLGTHIRLPTTTGDHHD